MTVIKLTDPQKFQLRNFCAAYEDKVQPKSLSGGFSTLESLLKRGLIEHVKVDDMHGRYNPTSEGYRVADEYGLLDGWDAYAAELAEQAEARPTVNSILWDVAALLHGANKSSAVRLINRATATWGNVVYDGTPEAAAVTRTALLHLLAAIKWMHRLLDPVIAKLAKLEDPTAAPYSYEWAVAQQRKEIQKRLNRVKRAYHFDTIFSDWESLREVNRDGVNP